MNFKPINEMEVMVNYRAKLQENESIHSAILRASEKQTILPEKLINALGIESTKIAKLIPSVILENKESVKELIIFNNWKPSNAAVNILNHSNYKKWMKFTGSKFCPSCSEKGFLPEYHDLSFIHHCIEHKLKLVDICPECKRKIASNRYGLNICACGETIKNTCHSNDREINETILLEKAYRESRFDYIAAYLELDSIIKSRFNINNAPPEILMDYVKGGNKGASNLIGIVPGNLKTLPLRAILSPIACANSSLLVIRTRQYLESLRHFSLCEKTTNTDFYMTRKELGFCLNTTNNTVSELLKRYYGIASSLKLSELALNLLQIESLFVKLQTNSISSDDISILEFISGSKESSIDVLIDILKGKLKVIHYNPNENLFDIRFSYTKKANLDKDNGYLTNSQVISYLQTHAEVIRVAREAGLLETVNDRDNHSKLLFSIESVKNFDKKYITGSRLGSMTGMTHHVISKKLMESGIKPVSMPNIEHGRVYIFNKDCIGKKQLEKIVLSMDDNKVKSGINSICEHVPDNCLNYDQVARKLNASKEDIQRLIGYKLLKPKVLLTESNKAEHYFDEESVEKVKNYISSLVSMEKLSDKIKLPLNHLRKRLHLWLRKEPILLNNEQYISKEDAKKLKEHCDKYLSSKQISTKYNLKRYIIDKLRREGYITSLQPGNDGYISSPNLYTKHEVNNLLKRIQIINDTDSLMM